MITGQLKIGGTTFPSTLICAPMVGITHSAFRRLLSEFGGYGALYTEMLSAPALLHESPTYSTFIRKRPEEGLVFYQLLLNGSEDLPAVLDKVAACGPAGIDLNCGCGAPDARHIGGGTALFDDPPRLYSTLANLRRHHSGLLTIKIRLGQTHPDWQNRFRETLKLIEDAGVDAITLHPRFSDEKLKRAARHELFPWVAELTKLPLIANGDIIGPETITRHPEYFAGTSGIMLGRIAAAQPWIFHAWHNPGYTPDYTAIWARLYDYIMEDFLPGRALSRLKIFTAYYARNFLFGHTLSTAARNARTEPELRERAMLFLTNRPTTVKYPTLSGI
jgi:tRNA-dihydrouridine synthase B